jgi:hypothetical protein
MDWLFCGFSDFLLSTLCDFLKYFLKLVSISGNFSLFKNIFFGGTGFELGVSCFLAGAPSLEPLLQSFLL